MSQSTKLLILLLAVVICAGLYYKLVFEPAQYAAETSANTEYPESKRVDIDELNPRLVAIYQADKIEDQYQRCMEYPDPLTIDWKPEIIQEACDMRWKPAYSTHELRQIMEAGNFSELEDSITAQRQAYQDDIDMEHGQYVAFNQFDEDSAWIDTATVAWLAAFPESPAAHVARAAFLNAKAEGMRQGLWLSSPDFDRAAFDSLMDESSALTLKAMELEPDFLPAYYLRIRNALYEPTPVARRFLAYGLRHDEKSYYLRNAFISRLRPRWGGSLEEMDDFVESAQKYADQNPRIERLIREPLITRARQFWRNGEHDTALEWFNRILDLGASENVLANMAALLKDQGDLTGAFEVRSQLFRINPWNSYNQSLRADILIDISEFTWARELLENALGREPGDYDLLYGYAALALRDLDYASAVKRYETLLEYFPNEVFAHDKIAWISSYRLTNRMKAKKHADAVIELEPENYHAWLYLSDYYHGRGGPLLKEATQNFLKYVDRDDQGMQQSIQIIENYVATHYGADAAEE